MPSPARISPMSRLLSGSRHPSRLAACALAAALAATSLGGQAPAQERQAVAPAQCPPGWKAVPPELDPVLRCLPDGIVARPAPGTQAPPQPAGCPDGWQPVPAGVNPILRCQPTRVGTEEPGRRQAPPPGCPDGWRPVPPGVNPALRCLPAHIAATVRARADAAPAGCPDGWKPVSPELNPVLRCLPGSVVARPRPQHGDRDPGGPGQGGDKPALGRPVFPDLALVDGLQLGSQQIPWGSSATLSADDAAFRRLGACGFRYLYRTRNQGSAGAAATSNRILRDAQDGPVLATKALPALAVDAVGVSDGHVSLEPGTWMLYVHADAPDAVAESAEDNNLRRVRVTVEGDCG